ncbi:chemotaxis protein CheW [Oceanobacillus halophilus]|uniref:Purine-binding chemotaxis protein CheW n=1 Tax=Oceanobacillus halophilus TaxID=930130 RepID=A0A495A010_9BACI|nr:chemotaxis protein CheW [Oceanobacillus halophilus]RKQ32531.1 purine-binding chemotaxis protein CheW [Oceanobacillus halophilus]
MQDYIKLIIFELNQQRYALDVQQVLSIEKLQKITMVPGSSEYVKGVMNLRGEVIPVMDLKMRLHIAKTNETESKQILIVNINGIQAGLMVDVATDVLNINLEGIENHIEKNGIIDDSFFQGLVKGDNDLIILLDLEKVLAIKELEDVK